MPRYKRNGKTLKSRLWWIEYRVGGKRVREKTKTLVRSEAETILRTRLAGLDRGDLPATGNATWGDLVALIKADYIVKGRRSVKRLELSLSHLDKTFAPTDRATSMTTDRIEAYRDRRLEEGAARGTVNRELSVISRAFKLGRKRGIVLVAPIIEKLEEASARTGFFERAEFDRLLKELPDDLKPLAVVSFVTGWRCASELCTREWRHVDFGKNGWLVLDPGEAKNREGRLFPLIPELRRAIQAQRKATPADCTLVFHHDGFPLVHRVKDRGVVPSRYLREQWTAACERAGIEGRLRHDFRRGAARALLAAGGSEKVVMQAMGWKSRAMLDHYHVVRPDDLIELGKRRAKLR